ncbi:MAG TPA: TIM barrel protein [Alphaproteobacteria bacterium]
MPRFSANLSMLFGEVAPVARIEAARRAGFDGVEIQFPYEIPVEDLAKACHSARLPLVLINIPAGDFTKGDRGLGALPGREAEFRAAVDLARTYAAALQVGRVNLLAGVPGPHVEPARCRATLVDNIRYAARVLGDIGVTVCIEAINSRDVPGFFVNDPDQAISILDEAGVPNAALQYDLYHMQIMRGDLIPTLTRLKHRIGHIQFADTPGRHEPGTGEINFENVFEALDRIGYDGWVGAEYVPRTTTAESLGWLEAWRARAVRTKLVG